MRAVTVDRVLRRGTADNVAILPPEVVAHLAPTAIPERDGSHLALFRRESRTPLNGVIETTFRCNLRCVHCYVNEDAGDAAEKARELSADRLIALVDEVADAGCLYLLITGGEIFVRPDFERVYLHAFRRGLLVTLFSNGTMVTERIADLLAEFPPQLVEISVYGHTRETYERVTRVPGSFDRCREGIARLVARRVPLKLKTMALTINHHEVADMERFAAELGTTFRFDGLLNPRVDCGANRNGDLQLSPEQIVALDLENPKRLADLRDFMDRACAPQPGAAAEHVYTCGAGENSFTVDPYGGLQMCQLSRRNTYELAQGSFAHAWGSYFPRLRERKWQSNDVCRRCNLMPLCGNCAGAAEMETGDAEGLIAHFCRTTHLRAWAATGAGSGHARDASCCLGSATAPVEKLIQIQVRRSASAPAAR